MFSNDISTVLRDHHGKQFPDWDIERMNINGLTLEEFCAKYKHRAPAYFPQLPWEQAYNHIKKFAQEPPREAN